MRTRHATLEESAVDLAIFLPMLNAGGVQRVFLRLAEALCKRGRNVHLVVGSCRGDLAQTLPRGLPVVNLGRERVSRCILPLASYLRDHRPCCILSGLTHTSVVALAANTLSGRPSRVLVAQHSTLSPPTHAHQRRLAAWGSMMLARLLFHHADLLIGITDVISDELASFARVSRSQVITLPNPVVPDDLGLRANEPVTGWCPDETEPLVIAVGRLAPEKDFSTLLQAFALVAACCAANLMILGDGPERPCLESLVTELGLGSRVRMPGAVSNPYPYMAAASVLVLSSRWEGLPTVLIEALALGTPVVATDCGGVREILNGGEFGTIVPVGDVEALSRAILSVLQSPRDTKADVSAYEVDRAVDEFERCVFGSTG